MATDGAESIKRVVIIFIYYFFLFSILTFLIGVTEFSSGDSIIMPDGSLSTVQDLKEKGGNCEYPKINGETWTVWNNNCKDTLADTSATCSLIEGCTWTDETINFFGLGYIGNVYCKGSINTTYYNDNEDLSGNKICNAVLLDDDEELCKLMGCTWADYSGMNEGEIIDITKPKSSLTNFLKAVKFAFGFDASIGLTGIVQLIFSILLFYVPLIILIGSVYSLMPFI